MVLHDILSNENDRTVALVIACAPFALCTEFWRCLLPIARRGLFVTSQDSHRTTRRDGRKAESVLRFNSLKCVIGQRGRQYSIPFLTTILNSPTTFDDE